MAQTQQHNNPRRMLLDMATGNHSGYWVEILHNVEDGTAAYLLHIPAEAEGGRTWHDTPPMPKTWDAIQMQYKWATDDETADAAILPKYDEKRTFTGDVAGVKTMAALCKWALK